MKASLQMFSRCSGFRRESSRLIRENSQHVTTTNTPRRKPAPISRNERGRNHLNGVQGGDDMWLDLFWCLERLDYENSSIIRARNCSMVLETFVWLNRFSVAVFSRPLPHFASSVSLGFEVEPNLPRDSSCNTSNPCLKNKQIRVGTFKIFTETYRSTSVLYLSCRASLSTSNVDKFVTNRNRAFIPPPPPSFHN